jgi:hypothetical protein
MFPDDIAACISSPPLYDLFIILLPIIAMGLLIKNVPFRQKANYQNIRFLYVLKAFAIACAL